MTYKHEIEALCGLVAPEKIKHVACTDCQHWAGKCEEGQAVTLPDWKIHICNLHQLKTKVIEDEK